MIDAKPNKLNILLLTITLASCGMKITSIENSDVYATRDFGFSQAVIFNHVIYGSGQVGWEVGHKLPENSDFNHQLAQTIINIERLLQSQKCSWSDVLHLRFYVVDLNEDKRKSIGNFLNQTFPNGYAPANTMLGISTLAREDLLIEIEFIAKIKQE